MKLVQVIPHSRLGGMQQVAFALDEELPARGITSSVLDLQAATDAFEGRSALPRLWASLTRTWRREHVDAVMAHTLKNAVFSLTAARVAGVGQRVVVVHTNRASLGTPRVAMLLALAASGTATDVVQIGQAAADSYASLPGFVHRRTRLVRNGVRLPATASEPRAERTGGPARLVVAGRLDAEKNVETAVRAVAGLERPVELHVYGDGTLRSDLETLAQDLAAPVVFHGSVPREELAAAYRDSDLFLFPTQAEGLPLVLIEVAATGLPVISSDLPSTREVMGPAARYCPPTDVAVWREAITTCLDDHEWRARMTREGLARADEFTVEQMVDGYVDLLAPTARP